MNTAEASALLAILKLADSTRKGDYRAYERYKKAIAAIGLNREEYEQAIRRLAKALNV